MGFEELLAIVSLEKIILIAVIAAFLELDAYFVGMTLISQPIIAGFITGYMLGDFRTGIIIGSVVQLIWLNTPHVGAYVPPSSSGIAVSTTFIAVVGSGILGGINLNAFNMFAMIFGVGVGYFIGQMDIWNRKFNTKIIHRFEKKILEGKEEFLIITQILAVSAKFTRDFVMYVVVFFMGTKLAGEVFVTMPEQIISGLNLAMWIMPAIGFAVVFDMFKTFSGGKIHGIILLVSYIMFLFFDINVFFYILMILTAGFLVVYNSIWKRNEV